MSDPWLPPYFGSWEEFINSLMHDPYSGMGPSGTGWHGPRGPVVEALLKAEPNPVPWRNAVFFLVSTISQKEAASRVHDERLRAELINRANRSISKFMDDYCGNGSIPIPTPGPPPWIQPTVSELVRVAHFFQEGSLRNEILNVAGAMLEKALTVRE